MLAALSIYRLRYSSAKWNPSGTLSHVRPRLQPAAKRKNRPFLCTLFVCPGAAEDRIRAQRREMWGSPPSNPAAQAGEKNLFSPLEEVKIMALEATMERL